MRAALAADATMFFGASNHQNEASSIGSSRGSSSSSSRGSSSSISRSSRHLLPLVVHGREVRHTWEEIVLLLILQANRSDLWGVTLGSAAGE